MGNLLEGLHPDVTMIDYINDPCPDPSISKGVIATACNKSMAHVYHEHPRLGGAPSSNSTRAGIGTVGHDLLLGGESIIEVIDAPDWRTKAAKGARDDAWLNGKTPILAKDFADVRAMVAISKPILESYGPGDTEQTMIWKSRGAWCRARPDWISKDRKLIIDFKTATTANPQAWAKTSLFAGNYDIQNIHYLAGAAALFGEDREREFMFFPQEITPPYCCSYVGLAPSAAELATRKRNAVIPIWNECLQSGIWPGYSRMPCWVEAPGYMIDSWENSEIGNT